MGQCPHRDGSVIGCHATKLVTGYEGCFGTQVCRADRSNDTRRPGADNDDVKHLRLSFYPGQWVSGFRSALTMKLLS
jgi:hypothetical protein